MILWVSLLQIKFITQFNLKAVKMNEKHVSLAAYICSAVMGLQIIKKQQLFEFCERKFKWMTKDDFEKVLKLVQEECAITGITDIYVYQTSTCLMPPKKSMDEIMSVLQQPTTQHHN
jgi:hypothetical protein